MPDRGGLSITVPERGNPDRKRALNVLAQRRYRQRRREKIQTLENRAKFTPSGGPQLGLMPSTPFISQPVSFLGFGILPTARSDTVPLPALEALPSQNDFADGHSNIIPDSNITYNSLPMTESMTDRMTDPLNFDMPPFYPMPDLGSELQGLESSQFTFPDDSTLDVPELKVMRAGLNIAEMLGCAESIWDFSTLRIINKSAIPTSFLPPNLEPTEVQRRIPHHPLFDLFPWPSVRTKFIIVFSQPVKTRPPVARDPMALMQLFYDMDDSAEGLKISGEDWYSGENWEVGQTFFKNWWWAFDREVVDNSNALRVKRGAGKLVVGPP